MIAQIIAHVHFFNFTVAIFALNEDIFKEIVIMLLHFFIGNICNHYNSKEIEKEMKIDTC